MKKKTAIQIPQVIYTRQFLKFVAFYANKFKASKGYGRWLVEYERMDKLGWFKPEKIRTKYVRILSGISGLSYIYKDAIHNIGSHALTATRALFNNSLFDIRLNSGEIALSDNDEELTGLTIEEALSTCIELNKEEGYKLFNVYNSNTNKIIEHYEDL